MMMISAGLFVVMAVTWQAPAAKQVDLVSLEMGGHVEAVSSFFGRKPALIQSITL